MAKVLSLKNIRRADSFTGTGVDVVWAELGKGWPLCATIVIQGVRFISV